MSLLSMTNPELFRGSGTRNTKRSKAIDKLNDSNTDAVEKLTDLIRSQEEFVERTDHNLSDDEKESVQQLIVYLSDVRDLLNNTPTNFNVPFEDREKFFAFL